VLVALLLCQAAIGLYGIAQPIAWGHEGYHVAEHGLAARNLVRHGAWIPSHHHGRGEPDPAHSTFHHPIMLHPYIAAAQTVVGEAAWGARGVQLLFSLLAVAGLWALARRVRDEATAALACAAFIVTPLNVSFSHLPDHQLVGLAYVLWSFVGLTDWLRTGRRFALALWLVASLLAGLTDWPFYPIAFLVFAALAWRAWRGGDEAWHPGVDRRRVYLGLAAFALVVLVPFVAHFAVAMQSDRWSDLMEAYRGRSSASDLGHFVGNSAWRLYAMHTPPLVIVLLVWVWRTVRRRALDLGSVFVLSVCIGQTIWLGVMQTEFLVHEYRSYWYVLPAAFAAGELGMRWMRTLRVEGRSEWTRRHAPALVLVAILGWSVWHLRHNMVTSRRMTGSVSYQHYQPRHELMTATRAVHAMTDPGDVVLIGGGLQPRKEMYYLLDRDTRKIWSPKEVEEALDAGESVVVMDGIEGLRKHATWRPIMWRARTLRIGDVVILDLRGSPTPAIDAGTLVIGEGYGLLERYLHAPIGGPLLIEDGPSKSAMWLARQLHSPDALVDSARSTGEVLSALPAELRAPSSKAAPTAPESSN
jgi:hypothetical protein